MERVLRVLVWSGCFLMCCGCWGLVIWLIVW